jgi:hypothetical protein
MFSNWVAIGNYRLWRRDRHHPPLYFRRLKGSGNRFSIRLEISAGSLFLN